jgi:hypothetical protein
LLVRFFLQRLSIVYWSRLFLVYFCRSVL